MANRKGLERIVRSLIPGRKNLVRQAVEYALPFLDRPDYGGVARTLLQDREIKKLNVSETAIMDYVMEGFEDYKSLRNFAILADSADKLISMVSMGIEAAGLAAGVIPGYLLNTIEETVEMALKAPFLIALYRDEGFSHRLKELLIAEGVTYALPAVGDIVDFGTNKYMKAAHDVIVQRARNQIIADSKSIKDKIYSSST